jgi:hypothetical protein
MRNSNLMMKKYPHFHSQLNKYKLFSFGAWLYGGRAWSYANGVRLYSGGAWLYDVYMMQ